ncbi:type II secretion system minor pseudopilin GspK [bacterium]|nr:type II secretion system minor pseudopilin GspK [bacterium]
MTQKHKRSWRLYLKDEQGVALLLVLIVVSIMGYLAFDFSYLVRLNMTSAANFRNGSKAYLLARSGIEACRALRCENKNDWDSLDELWATERPPVMAEGGLVEISLVDENSKINVNKLALTDSLNGPAYSNQFQRLCLLLDLDVNIVDYISDWVDQDSEGDAENQYYLRLNPPYECKNGKIDTVYELLMVRGITDEVFFGSKDKPGLIEFVTTRPELGVNINTADVIVLQTLHEDLTEEIAWNIIQAREVKPFKNISELKSRGDETEIDQTMYQNLTECNNYITVKGDVFLARSVATVDDYTVRVQALIGPQGRELFFWKRF